MTRPKVPSALACALLFGSQAWIARAADDSETVLYKTAFEKSEGYDPKFTLAGQRGWVMDGTGGNGLLESIPTMGQQAYIGIYPPTDTNQTTSVWTPVNFSPPTNSAIVKFSVTLQFYQSLTGGNDEFRWAVYNSSGSRLFSIDFFTSTQRIDIELEDRQLIETGWTFDFADAPDDGIYTLEIWMDFARNTWSALMNDAVIGSGERIAQQTTTALNLGDIDAVWAIDNARSPGDNVMLFDDYTVSTQSVQAIPSSIEARGPNEKGNFELQLYTQPGIHYSVDVTENFEDWFSLSDFVANEGTSIFEDTTSHTEPLSFYRLREVD
jgi:hypothetical protein